MRSCRRSALRQKIPAVGAARGAEEKIHQLQISPNQQVSGTKKGDLRRSLHDRKTCMSRGTPCAALKAPLPSVSDANESHLEKGKACPKSNSTSIQKHQDRHTAFMRKGQNPIIPNSGKRNRALLVGL